MRTEAIAALSSVSVSPSECGGCSGESPCASCGGGFRETDPAVQALRWGEQVSQGSVSPFWRTASIAETLREAPGRDGAPAWSALDGILANTRDLDTVLRQGLGAGEAAARLAKEPSIAVLGVAEDLLPALTADEEPPPGMGGGEPAPGMGGGDPAPGMGGGEPGPGMGGESPGGGMGGEDGNGVNPISKLRPHTCQLQIYKDEEELAKSPELAAIAKAAFEKRAAVSADRKKNNKSGLGNDRGVRKLGQTLTDAKVGPDALVGENTLAFMAVFRFTCEDSPKAVLEWNRTLGKDVPDDKIPPDNNPASDVTIQNDGTNKLGGECWIAALDTAGKQFSRPGGAPKIPWQKFRIVGTVKWETGDSCTKEAVVEYTPSPPKMGKKDPKDQFEQPSDISDPAKGEVKVTYGGGSEKR